MHFFRIFFAHGYGQLVTVVTNFILPSVLVGALGIEDFGFWVMAGALSQILLFSDFGYSSALSNYLVINSSLKIRKNNNILFFVLIFSVLSAIIFSAIAAFLVSFFWSEFSGALISNKNNIYILFCILLVAALNPAHNIIIGVSRLENCQSHGIIITNTLRLIEGISICTFAIIYKSLYVVSVIYCGVRSFSVLLVIFYVAKNYGIPNKKNEFLEIFIETKKLFNSSFSHFTSGISQNLSMHVPTLLLGYFMGSTLASSFSITRTLCRVPVQFIGIFLNSISPRLTEIGFNSVKDLKKITNNILWGTLFFLTIVYLIIGIYGLENISSKWMHGKLNIDFTVYMLVAIGTIFATLSLVVLNSGNSINSPLNLGLVQMLFFLAAVFFLIVISSDKISLSYYLIIFLVPEFVSLVSVYYIFMTRIEVAI